MCIVLAAVSPGSLATPPSMAVLQVATWRLAHASGYVSPTDIAREIVAQSIASNRKIDDMSCNVGVIYDSA